MHSKYARCLSLLLVLPLFLTQFGCESDSDADGSYWQAKPESAPAGQEGAQTPPANPAKPSDPAAPSNPSNPSTPSQPGEVPPQAGAGDAVPFAALNWSFGGVNGSGAAPSGVQISGLHMSTDNLTFKYNRDLSAWGVGHSDHSKAYACLFVQKSDGSWVGGKFDWISSSRTSRDFINIYEEHYHGWSFSGVPNPCKAAFVILHKDRKKRSNVISGTWHHR